MDIAGFSIRNRLIMWVVIVLSVFAGFSLYEVVEFFDGDAAVLNRIGFAFEPSDELVRQQRGLITWLMPSYADGSDDVSAGPILSSKHWQTRKVDASAWPSDAFGHGASVPSAQCL